MHSKDIIYKTAVERVGVLFYIKVHNWLNNEYGKANKCEICKKDKPNYHWALKNGMEYDFNKDNFIQLCVSCHRKYDYNEDVAKRISETLKKLPPRENRYIPIIKIDLNGLSTEYSGISVAAKENHILRTSILNCLSGRSKSAGGHRWIYK